MPFLSHRKGIRQLLRPLVNSCKPVPMPSSWKVWKVTRRCSPPGALRHSCDGAPWTHPSVQPYAGGYKVQGGEPPRRAAEIQAQELERLGCFSIVLECIPETLGGEIARSLAIPVIGIGAGGKSMVRCCAADLLGLTEFKTTFVRRYMEGASMVEQALNDYCRDITTGSFLRQARCSTYENHQNEGSLGTGARDPDG